MLTRRLFVLAAVLEALTLVVLLSNRMLTHDAGVASAVGPVHGVSYLLLLLLAALAGHMSRRARWLSVIPGVGGLLSVLVERRRTAQPGSDGHR